MLDGRLITTGQGWWLIKMEVDAWHGGHRSPSISVFAARPSTLTEHGFCYLCGCISSGEEGQTTCDIVCHSIFTRRQAEEMLIGLVDQYLLRSPASPNAGV
jgi:hypothetical protein